MSGVIVTNPKVQFTSPTGAPLANGTVSTYLAGTTTAASTWQDSSLSVLNTNPITLDSRGEALVWLDPAKSYKFVLANASNSIQWTVDNIVGAEPAGLRAALFAPTGSSLIGWIRNAIGAVARTIADILLGRPFEPEDFGATGGSDDTDAINKMFTAAALANKPCRLNRIYNVGNLLYGSQATGAQSNAPPALIGTGVGSSGFKAIAGLTGTLLQSWSVAGVTFRDFVIDVTGTAAMAWDCEWKPGTGPSTQNVIENITVQGGTGATLVNLKNLNDTFPNKLVVNATAASQCCIDMTQGGGLAKIFDSIWNGGFLRFGCQNGVIDTCWGMGIEFAQSCLNYVTLPGCYIYGNTSKGYVLWSQSFAALQSVRALKAEACQFITVAPHNVPAFFDLNAYSTLDFDACQFTGAATNLFGPDCRRDSFADVLVRVRGGSIPSPALAFNEPAGFHVEASGVMIDSTGYNLDKDWSGTFTPTAYGGTVAGATTYTTQSGNWYRIGNRVFARLRVAWSAATGTGQLTLGGLPFTPTGGDGAVAVAYVGSTFSGIVSATQIVAQFNAAAGIVTFWAFNGATGLSGAANITGAGDLIVSLDYEVTA